jgi:hypothetical protein
MTRTHLCSLLIFAILLPAANSPAAQPRARKLNFKAGRKVASDFNLDLLFTVPSKDKKIPDPLIAIGRANLYAFLELSPDGQLRLGSIVNGKEYLPVKKELPIDKNTRQLALRIKLRSSNPGYIALLSGGQELARTSLPPLGKSPSVISTGNGILKITSYQKVDRNQHLLLGDDFSRGNKSLAPWKPELPGLWRINATPHPETSASPFALECLANPQASSVRTGMNFWDDYRARVAVNILNAPGSAGLLINLNGNVKGSYFLLRLKVSGEGAGGRGQVQLLRMNSNKPGQKGEVLASREIQGRAGSWYELELAFSGGSLRAWVDGVELARLKNLKDLIGGAVGLWNSGASGVRFDDVEVTRLKLTPAQLFRGGDTLKLARRSWFRPAPTLPEKIQNDYGMRSWARLQKQFRTQGEVIWHCTPLAGAMQIAWQCRGKLRGSGQLTLALAADGQNPKSGYRLLVDSGSGKTKTPKTHLRIYAKETLVVKTTLSVSATALRELSFSREANQLVARLGSRIVLSCQDHLKLSSGFGAAKAQGNWSASVRELSISAANLIDETFDRAPVEWSSISGDWQISSRWKCQPKFTWFSGRARNNIARLDLKRPLGQNFQADLFFAIAMATRAEPFYDFPTNLSLALSENPQQPTEGYVFAFGGIDLPSRLLRAGKLLASSEVVANPRAREHGNGSAGIHRKWFHVRIIRQGKRLQFFGDGRLLADFEDPQPLKNARHLSLWTRAGGGVSLARFRLQTKKPLALPDSTFIKKGPLLLSTRPPALKHFHNRDGSNGARLDFIKQKQSPTSRTDAQELLRLTNVNAGGTFAAAWSPPARIDLADQGCLSFSIRGSNTSRVNLYLLRSGHFYRLQLSPKVDAPGGHFNLRALGKLPLGQLDKDKWQNFSCDLGAALAAAEPRASNLLIDEIRIGNYETGNSPLIEGYTGNRAGDYLEISDWKLANNFKAPPPIFKIETQGAAILKSKLPPGRIDPRTIMLRYQDRKITFNGTALDYDAPKRMIILRPDIARLALKTGQSQLMLSYRLFPNDPFGGQVIERTVSINFDPKKDKTPPGMPVLLRPAPLDFQDFEKDIGNWSSLGGQDGAGLLLDRRRPRQGRQCLLAENLNCGGMLSLLARKRPMDVRAYPTLSFDFCAQPRSYLDLLLFTSNGCRTIGLTDPQPGSGRLTSIDGLFPNGRWKRVNIDLQKVLRLSGGNIVHSLGFGDLGPGNCCSASAFRIDNWIILPAINGNRPVSFAWQAGDPSGIAGYSALLDQHLQTLPPEKINNLPGKLLRPEGLRAGIWYLHVRARDRSGNWSPSTHWRFSVVMLKDRTAPRITSVTPAADSVACPARIEIQIEESGSGVNAHDLELKIGKEVFRPGDQGVTFYPSSNRMTLSLTDFQGRLRFAAGKLHCRLRVGDFAGNNNVKDYQWSWQLDPRADTDIPAAPRIIYLPSDHLFFQDFEKGQGDFSNWRRATAWRRKGRRIADAGLGKYFIRLGKRRDDGRTVNVYPRTFDPKRYCIMAFDYRFPRRAANNFYFEIANSKYYLEFSGWYPYSRDAKRLGSLPAPKNDNQWRRVVVDFRKLRPGLPRDSQGAYLPIQKLCTSTASDLGGDFDNFILASPYGKNPGFIWDPPVTRSGISGYSWILDKRPRSIPPEKINGQQTQALFKNVKPGRHYFHLRAKSKGGRWSPAAHLRIDIEEKPRR